MRKQNIEKSFEYWDKHKGTLDYCKYMKFNDGDIIIDGGAAFSSDTQYFDKQVGDNGIVYAFDPNMVSNNNIESKSKKIISKVLWDKTTKVSFIMDGSRSRVSEKKYDGTEKFSAITIDDFVKNQHLNRLDFIKLDVEGAEMNVLRGGVNSILKFRPGFAISIYHKLEDFFNIALFLDELLTDYVFHIDYFNPYCIDTILFAVPIEREFYA
jgi:FkbM family methyltransferase